mmetsp:Transcript_3426/g.5239  ORF Transcript_3426/g.5239 Transcript_3426/m.5239 type:complete len:1331 (+) Transcript_3426:147-4139(+)
MIASQAFCELNLSIFTAAFRLFFLAFVFILPFGRGQTESECHLWLRSFDQNGDGSLDRSEYVALSKSMGVVKLSFDWSFSDLPAVMQEAFTYMAGDSKDSAIDIRSVSRPTDSSPDVLTECEVLGMAVAKTDIKPENGISRQGANPIPSLPQCYVGILVAESSTPADNFMNSDEYVTFVNRFSSVSFGDDFLLLPQALRNNFENLAQRDDQIFTFGVESVDEPSQVQLDFLNQVCTDTSVAISIALLQQPTASPQILTTTLRPTLPLSQCFAGLLNSEQFQDDQRMDQKEYMSFLNYLEPGAFDSENFNDLSQRLKDNFFRLSVNGSINIADVYNPHEEQRDFLQRICDDTNAAITLDLISISQPTSSPLFQPSTPRPTRPLNQCFVGMLVSDDPQDNKLSRDEYALFMNFLQPGSFDDVIFKDLPKILKDNFEKWAVGDSIDMSPFENDEERLEEVCNDTNEAISVALYPKVQPTLSPTLFPVLSAAPSKDISPKSNLPSNSPSESPTDSIGEIEIVSQFVVSNSIGLRASDLRKDSSDEKRKLEIAFTAIVRFTIEKIFTTPDRYIRTRRKLAVNYIRTYIRDFTDRSCPQSAPSGSFCQNVVALIFVGISGEEMEQEVAEKAKEEVDKVILNGRLQTELSARTSVIRVEFDDFQNSPSPSGSPSKISLAPSVALSGGEVETRSSDSDDTLSNIVYGCIIVGILIFLLLIMSLFFYLKSKCQSAKKDLADAEKKDAEKSENTDIGLDDGLQEESDEEDGKKNSMYAFDPPLHSQQPKALGWSDGLHLSSSDDSGSSESSSDESDSSISDLEQKSPPQLQNSDRPNEVSPKASAESNSNRGITQTLPAKIEKKTASPAIESDSDSSESDSGWEDEEESSSYAEDSEENVIPIIVTKGSNDGKTQVTGDESGRLGDGQFKDTSNRSKNSDLRMEDFETLYASGDEAELYHEPSSSISLSPPKDEDYDVAKPLVKSELESIALEAITDPHNKSSSRDLDLSNGSFQLDNSSRSGPTPEANAQTDSEVLSAVKSADSEKKDDNANKAGRKITEDMGKKEKKEQFTSEEDFIQEGDGEINQQIVGIPNQVVEQKQHETINEKSRIQNNPRTYSESDSDSYTSGSFVDDSSYTNESDSGSGSYNEDYTTGGDSESCITEGLSTVAKDPSQAHREQEIRADIEALIRVVVPKEKDNVDAMMERFKGREEELLQTLKTMQEKGVTARARAAAKKRKTSRNPSQSSSQAYESEQTSPVSSKEASSSGDHSSGSSYTSESSATSSVADRSESQEEGLLRKYSSRLEGKNKPWKHRSDDYSQVTEEDHYQSISVGHYQN